LNDDRDGYHPREGLGGGCNYRANHIVVKIRLVYQQIGTGVGCHDDVRDDEKRKRA